jgi:hypothetical protein
MLSENDILSLQSQRKYFIENETEATYFQWLRSRGTNFTCYINYLNSLDDEQKVEYIIEDIRTSAYAINKPIQFAFFYWTILIFILYKFNFKKPIMKIVLIHYILRALGDVLDKLGDLNIMSHYYTNNSFYKTFSESSCSFLSPTPEMNPLRWFITRQIGCAFWHVGEIVGDWYPLIRTRALAKGQKMMWYVYISCGIFNLTKLTLIILHFTLSPTELYENGMYNRKRINDFYCMYWIIQLIIICASLVYDFSVYYVLKKNLKTLGRSPSGFIKKFKTISQYRIYISVIISLIFLPLICITICIKFYYYNIYKYRNLNFAFDEIKISINNVQYYMIFIDQILLLLSRNETIYSSSYSEETSLPTTTYSNKNQNETKYKNQNTNISESFTNSYQDQDQSQSQQKHLSFLDQNNRTGDFIIKFSNNNNYYNID